MSKCGQPLPLPGWERVNIGRASLMAAHDLHFSNFWTVAFQPPMDWPGRLRVVNPSKYLWRPMDVPMPVPSNPDFWTSDDPVILTGPVLDVSPYRRMLESMNAAIESMRGQHAQAIARAIEGGRSPVTDPACKTWHEACETLRQHLSKIFP